MKLTDILPFLAVLTLAASIATAAPLPPNVVFILADDLGWADTTLYGHTKYYQTPNLERLAKRGMTFTRAYSASPLCSPTRSSIMTGLSPARTGITVPNCHEPKVVLAATPGTKAPPDKQSIPPVPVSRLKTEYSTLAETLKDAGYATGHFGKWHLGPEPYSPLQQGFDVDMPHWPGPGPAGSYVAPWKFTDFDADPGEPKQHIEDRMAKEAVAFIEKNKDRPFFLNYWMFSVHAPFDAKKALIEKYRALANPADPQHCPTFAAMVESMDDAIGTLLDTLDRLQLSERTIIVFSADNGGNMYNEVEGAVVTSNAPLRGGKATVFEGGIRVPAIVRWPGITADSSRNDTIVQSSDYYPMLLDGLGLKPAPGQSFDGISILPALRGEPLAREATFTYFPHDVGVPDWLPPAVVVHSGDWKLIRIFHGGENGAHRWKLFNLRDDLGETNDLAAREPARVRQLDALIEKFLIDTKAVVPVPNPAFDPASYHPELEGRGVLKGKGAKGAKKAAADADATDALKGWKARSCLALVKDGIVTVTGQGPAPYLGVGAGIAGPAVAKLRVRCANGGGGKIELVTPAKVFPISLQPGDWQEITIDLPETGPTGNLRVYLPAQKQPVEIDWIELTAAGKPRRWNF